jgi:hypothetical protein
MSSSLLTRDPDGSDYSMWLKAPATFARLSKAV